MFLIFFVHMIMLDPSINGDEEIAQHETTEFLLGSGCLGGLVQACELSFR